MSKITLANLVNLQNQTTAVNAINGNNSVLTTAFDNTLSRDGTTPNQMGSTLDMNSNRIINVGSPLNANDAVRLTDLQASGSSGAASAALAAAVAAASASQTAAAGSATTATTQAGIATTQAGIATTQATNAATSATNSLNSYNNILALGVLTNVNLAKTTNYTVLNADSGKNITLGGNAFYTLTFAGAAGYSANFQVGIINTDTGRGKTISLAGVGTFILWPGQSACVFNVNNVWKVNPVFQRYYVQSPTFFVDPVNGNDSNDGLATGTGAFLTIQAAVNNVAKNTDLLRSGATIQLADGTYNVGAGVNLNYQMAPGSTLCSIQGNVTTPNNVLVQCNPGGSCFNARDGGATWALGGMLLSTTGNGSTAISVSQNSVVDICAAAPVNFNPFPLGTHINVTTWASLNILGNYSVLGAAPTHIHADSGALIGYGSFTVTGSSSLGFTTFASASNCGVINAGGVPMVFSGFGSVTGTRYTANANGVISSTGTVYPGNAAGTTSTGGQYS